MNSFVTQVRSSDEVEIIDSTFDWTMWVTGDVDTLEPDEYGYRVIRINDNVHKLQKSHPDLEVLASQADDRVKLEYRSQRSNNLIEVEGIVEDIPGAEDGETKLVAIRDLDSDDDPWEMRRVVVGEELIASSYKYVPTEDRFGHFESVTFKYERSSKLGSVEAFVVL